MPDIKYIKPIFNAPKAKYNNILMLIYPYFLMNLIKSIIKYPNSPKKTKVPKNPDKNTKTIKVPKAIFSLLIQLESSLIFLW